MRRTLALAGAAVLAVGLGGLAGPASADTGIAQQQSDALVNEVAVNLVSASGFEGTFIEFTNLTASAVPLDEYMLETCSATGSIQTVLDESDFASTHEVPVNGTFLIGDVTFRDSGGPTPDIMVEDLGLDRSDGGVRLTDIVASEADSVEWGSPTDLTCAAFTSVGVTPSDLQSINRHPTSGWPSGVNESPTPTNSAGETN